ncbi:MAG: GGDEF domain-containing protein [Acetobacteraceae bacterium]|nr:GGDEF domain-containing protein [Acetobacteraceae bacterium]
MPNEAGFGFLSQAVKQHLHSVLQPIVDLRTGETHAYEALMRGHTALGHSDPLSLLDAFAARGAIEAIEFWLHHSAVSAFATAMAVGDAPTAQLFINIDSRAIERAGTRIMHATLADIASRGLPAGRVCWELSERHPIVFDAATVRKMIEIREAGVRFAADDFGQGHSEMKLLFDQQVDYIKIDKFYITSLPESGRRRLFVKKIANFARTLGVSVIAEGVENAETLMVCRDLGCDLAQGWFIGWPVLAKDLSAARGRDVIASMSGTRRTRRASDRTLRAMADRMLPIEPVDADASIEQVIERLMREPDQTLCPVVEGNGVPIGVVPERRLREVVYQPYGRDLLRNQATRRKTRNFVDPCPRAEIDSDLDEGLEAFAMHPQALCLILTEGGRYIGMLPPGTLLTETVQRRLADASAQNPLTGLPGNLRLQAALERAALGGGEYRHVCYFDFDNFKPFNDENGFRNGDRAIALFAEALRRILPDGEHNCIGHVGGDDFVAVLHAVSSDEICSLVVCVLRDFAEAVKGLHKDRDRQNGWYETRDRYGEPRRFPLLRVSCAVIALGPGLELEEHTRLDPIIARLKSIAKSNADGVAWLQADMEADIERFALGLEVQAA